MVKTIRSSSSPERADISQAWTLRNPSPISLVRTRVISL
ncbi:hypothetical protein KPSA3_07520 [Pseudomonas syringae pv. actinidiae]|uniref:Uncharacterized protein n=1 Tax=Pseudomonas syringae pv. actinidiae TaxID=103796 RepID=A0AAN4QEJ2_PSESF|nr:hypothetical protein KPSA3_07520 [Pseudomonas syringae pv. actinidiae]